MKKSFIFFRWWEKDLKFHALKHFFFVLKRFVGKLEIDPFMFKSSKAQQKHY